MQKFTENERETKEMRRVVMNEIAKCSEKGL